MTGQIRRPEIRPRPAPALPPAPVYGGMDYILMLVFFLVVPIVVFFLLKERPHRIGGPSAYDRGVTYSEPAADQPTPQADAVNQVKPGKEKQIPPG